MKSAFARPVAGLALAALVALACRPNEPIDPKMPPNSPLPTIDRPEDPAVAPPPKLPRSDPDGGATRTPPEPGPTRGRARH